jgi:hypothetical protein
MNSAGKMRLICLKGSISLIFPVFQFIRADPKVAQLTAIVIEWIYWLTVVVDHPFASLSVTREWDVD